MKYLVVFVVVLLAYMVWRSRRSDEIGQRGRPGPGAPQDMVRCAVCALHLPRSDALAGPDGALYCSSEHRLKAGS